MKKVTILQRDWLGWILTDQRDWFNKHIEASEAGRLRISKAYLNMEYDTMTEHLLNYILEEFNKDGDIVNKWKGRHV